MLGLRQGLPLAVNCVAGQARDGGPILQTWVDKLPGILVIHGPNHAPNPAIRVHPVTAQAIVHQEALPVVPFTGKGPRIGHRVGAGTPLRELLPVAAAALLRHREDVRGWQVNLFRNIAR